MAISWNITERNFFHSRQHEGSEEALIITKYQIMGRNCQKFGSWKWSENSGINVLFDFSKAFVRCWKEDILFKLRKAGIYGHL